MSMLNKDTEEIYVGNGIWDWMKPPEPRIFKVEDLYEGLREDFWWCLDCIFVDRPDLQDRIEKFKKTKRYNI